MNRMLHRCGLVLGVLALVASSGVGQAAEPVAVQSEPRIVRVYYPDPFDAEMALMGRWEDRLVYLHRARFQTTASSELPRVVVSTLAKALADYQQVTAAATRAWLQADIKARSGQVCAWLEGSRIDGDRAAFAPLFAILTPAEKAGFGQWPTLCAKAAAALEEPTSARAYAASAAADPDFARRSPLVTAWRQIKDDLHRVVVGVTSAFALERVMVFAERARRAAGDGPLAESLLRFRQRLARELLERIDDELAGQVANDLCRETTTLIALQSDGGNQGLVIKQSLLRGRLHRLAKLVQSPVALERELFLPLLYRGVTDTVRKLSARATRADQKAYLDKVASTIDNVVRFSSQIGRNQPAPVAAPAGDRAEDLAIRAWLLQEDRSGLFAGLQALDLR